MWYKLLLALVSINFPAWCGQSLVLTPGLIGSAVDPNLSSSQSWQVEFQIHDWTLPPAGKSTAYIFQFAGVGAAVALWPNGSLALYDVRDTLSPTSPCFLSLTGRNNVLVRFQRDAGQKTIVCELWDSNGAAYARDRVGIATINPWPHRGGAFGSSFTQVSLAFLRVSTKLVAEGSKPPTTSRLGNWTELKFNSNLKDVSGNSHTATVPGAKYTDTPQGVAALFKTVSAPAWSNWLPMRAGYPGQLDGSTSYSLGDVSDEVSYLWEQIAGPTTVQWSSRTVAKPVIEGLIFGAYTFRLRVTDAEHRTAATEMQVGAVASDNKGVVVYPDERLYTLLGPSIRFGIGPWEWLDAQNKTIFEHWANKYEINGGSWRLESDLESLNGVPRRGTVFSTAGDNHLYGAGTNFKDVFCGGKAGAAKELAYIVPKLPLDGPRAAPRPYPRLVASCESDTQLTMANGWIWERPTLTSPGVAWGTWNLCTDCGAWAGRNRPSNINYYDNALAHYALYYRSGWGKARDSARWLADRWYRAPMTYLATAPRELSLASTFLRASIDGGHPQYDLWPSLRALVNTCYESTYAWIQDAPLVDVREVAYCQAFTALQAKLDPNLEQKTKAQKRLITSYKWIWGPQQKQTGNYVSNLIEGDMSRTFLSTRGSDTFKLHRGAPLPADYCGEALVKGGSISLAGDRTTITGVGTNFVGSAGKVIFLRGSLEGQPWSMAAEIAASPVPTETRLTLVHPWRGDVNSISASKWKILKASIWNTGYHHMFFGQTKASGEYPNPQVIDEDNWYWCEVTSPTTLTLDKPYTGDTSDGKIYRRPSTQNLAGRGSQPFMQGIAAWAMNLSALALDGYDSVAASLYRASADRVVDWLWKDGRNPATKGLFYGVGFSNCRNLTLLPAFECGQGRGGASNERAYNVENNGAIAAKYLNQRKASDLSAGDAWFNDQFSREGFASPLPSDGSFAELIDSCCFAYGEKAYGQVFGIGQSHQWPAARLGGVDPPVLVKVDVPMEFGAAVNARISITAPSSAITKFTCAASPCQVVLDRRQGSHWLQTEFLSKNGDVVSRSEPRLIHVPAL